MSILSVAAKFLKDIGTVLRLKRCKTVFHVLGVLHHQASLHALNAPQKIWSDNGAVL